MKQTAIEWLINEMHKKEQGLIETSYNHLFDQAKEMEKQQTIDFANDLLAQNNVNYIAVPDLAEQYYNETFKNK
jgi:hypothetical protein